MKHTPAQKLPDRSVARAARLAARALRLEKRVALMSQRLTRHRNLRLAVAGLFAVALVVLVANPRLRLEVVVIAVFAICFSILVVRSRRIDRHLSALRRLRIFNDRQERRLRGMPAGRPWEHAARAAEEMARGAGPGTAGLKRDLGTFGEHSLWTLIDETMTDGGQLRLIDWLTTGVPSRDEILRRQETVRSLRRESWFLTKLTLQGSDDFRLSSAQILLFLKKPFLKPGFQPLLVGVWLVWLLGLAWIGWSAATLGKIPPWPFLIFAAANFGALMRSSSPFKKGVGLSHHLWLLAPIFALLENRLARSARLQLLCPVTQAAGPSREARKLNRVLAFMSVEANPLVQLIVNLFLPWSLTTQWFLERRRVKIAFSFPQCLEELAELEALGSLVIFDRYQTDIYPTIADARRPSFTAEALFHPLIARDKVVANDFAFPQGKHLGLLTGSNMSGKSTFLRTVGINQILANAGAPVFAASLVTCPLKIETCIEVSDSLRDGYSYFYAEVRRLKALLDVARSGDKTLFLIDEIFRGTNNRERQIGSRAVIRELAGRGDAFGFVSTHDLELTSLEKSLAPVLNLHFREEFSTDNRMIFSYQLHHGPCPTTNALKIMAAEGIDVGPETESADVGAGGV